MHTHTQFTSIYICSESASRVSPTRVKPPPIAASVPGQDAVDGSVLLQQLTALLSPAALPRAPPRSSRRERTKQYLVGVGVWVWVGGCVCECVCVCVACRHLENPRAPVLRVRVTHCTRAREACMQA